MKTKQFLFVSIILILFVASCSKNSYDNEFYDGGDYYEPQAGGEQYNEIIENQFINTADNPISTFSIDVDGGAYSNSRRFLNGGQMPPENAIRTEEFINYFKYDYGEPTNEHPFSYNGEVAVCPWNTDHKLVRIGLKGKDIPKSERLGTSFIFLIDVSGSMSNADKLPLLKDCFKLLVEELDERDRVAIVTYAGSAGIILQSTSADNKDEINDAIDQLGAGGSTAGAEGIITAYEIAEANFIEGGNNRIVIGTDGDFNVGVSSQEELIAMIKEKRETGVFLTTIGVGTGNLNEGMLEQLANNGNGNFEYIDNLEQGKKVFIYDFMGFYPVAKDVKIQVNFNPNIVESYRLIGYENRVLDNEDFENDSTDAGELGSNQCVTALYELIMQDSKPIENAINLAIRYKLPNETASTEFNYEIFDSNTSYENASEDFRFATAVASFALIMRNSDYKGTATYDDVINWVENADTYNPNNYKAGLIDLINIAKQL